MTDEMTAQPPAEELFDKDLADMVNGMATGYFRKYGRHSSSVMITIDDLETEGYVGATVAYQTFDRHLGATTNYIQSFRTYAYPYIKAAMNAYCRRYSHVLSISERDSRDNMSSINSIQVVHIDHQTEDSEGFDIPVGSGVEASQEVSEYLFAGLSKLEVDLVKGHIINEHSLQELADEYGLSKSRAGEIIRAAKDKMKERVEDYV
jgi:RNA polymerase sigma factor (sigma-70 family)